MKNLFVLLVFTLIATFAEAQNIEISEAPRNMGSSMENSFSFELPDVTLESTVDQWEKWMKAHKAKTKYDRKQKLYTSTKAQMPKLSNDPINIYASIIGDKKGKEGVAMIVWFEDNGSFISTTEESNDDAANKLLTEFALSTSKHHAQSIVDAELKKLEQLEKEMTKLIKDNRNYNKAIEKAKDTIAKNEKNIEINEQDQKKKEAAIEAQKQAVQKAKDYVKTYANIHN